MCPLITWINNVGSSFYTFNTVCGMWLAQVCGTQRKRLCSLKISWGEPWASLYSSFPQLKYPRQIEKSSHVNSVARHSTTPTTWNDTSFDTPELDLSLVNIVVKPLLKRKVWKTMLEFTQVGILRTFWLVHSHRLVSYAHSDWSILTGWYLIYTDYTSNTPHIFQEKGHTHVY